ncbi:MAG: transposase [Thermosipho sp. (in: Bacteria)]|nr:transposase [Thermosipho sp. (in: thermotogales)]
MRKYIKKVKENNLASNKNEKIISRSKIIKLLYMLIEKIKGLSKEDLRKIMEKYKFLKEIYRTLKEFKEIFSMKSIKKLHGWIKKYEKSKIREIRKFIVGLKRDIVAVENAIKYDYSNGLAEGKINKIKLIKRKMYGRNNFETLRNRVLMLEHNCN